MTQGWQLVLPPGDASLPVYLRIARAIADEIKRGRIRPRERLLGTRRLAAELGVHRNTVVAAYEELRSEGLVEASAGRGFFVPADLAPPEDRGTLKKRKTSRGRPAFDLPAGPRLRPFVSGVAESGVLKMAAGVPDLSLFPFDRLARAYRRVIKRHGPTLLAYADPKGHPALRHEIAEMLSVWRGVPSRADDILITRGAQMALFLTAQVLLEPGDVVCVEAYGYPPAWHALRHTGAELVAVPVDSDGLVVERLEAILSERSIKAVYVTPHHQHPTTVSMSPARRMALLQLAAEHRFAIIEDDYDHEIHYEGQPLLPLASQDDAGSVIYVGTLSKVLAPGLRLGFLTGPHRFIERAAQLRTMIDRQGDSALEAAVAELMEEGDVFRFVRRQRKVYRARRALLMEGLEAELEDRVSFEVPRGGLALWVARTDKESSEPWSERARAQGVSFAVGRIFNFHRRRGPYARLGFASVPIDRVPFAVSVLAKTF